MPDGMKHSIRTVMRSSRDAEIIDLWIEKQRSPHTRGCYRLDSERLLNHTKKPLSGITLAHLQSFAQSLIDSGLALISCARWKITIIAVRIPGKYCFGKTPMQTFLDSRQLAWDKILDRERPATVAVA
jgi:hypothetical protein